MFRISGDVWHIDKTTEMLAAYGMLNSEQSNRPAVIAIFCNRDLSICEFDPEDTIPVRIVSLNMETAVRWVAPEDFSALSELRVE